MSLSATYDGVLSRIRLAGSSLGASAAYAVFDRTTDGGVTWTTVRGGTEAPVASQAASIDDYEWAPGVATTYRVRSYTAGGVVQQTFTTSITQNLDQVWLKVPAAPYLNQPVEVMDRSGIVRRSRQGLFDVVGRTAPVRVADVASSRAYTLTVLTRTAAAESDLDYLCASGEALFVQTPTTVTYMPSGYFAPGDVTRAPVSKVSELMVWDIPLTEIAAPGPDVVGSAYTIASMIAEYPTVADVIADNATISDLLQRVGSASDVIVS